MTGTLVTAIVSKLLKEGDQFENDNAIAVDIRLREHRTSLPSTMRVVIPTTPSDVSKLIDLGRVLRPSALDQARATVPLLLLLSSPIRSQDEKALIEDHFVVTVPIHDLLDVSAERIPDWILDTVLARLPALFVSPYQTEGPVWGRRFFGRDNTLRLIKQLTEQNYVVTGIRRIGKSSLIAQLYFELKKRDLTIYRFTVEGADDPTPMLQSIVAASDDADRRIRKRVVERKLDPFKPDEVRSFFKTASRAGRNRIVLLLDEVDSLLASDALHSYGFLQGLRSSAEEGFVTTVLAGGVRLRKTAADRGTPLFNFGRKIRMDRFSHDEAKHLIKDPLHDMKIALDDLNFVGRVIELSGGHPQVLQYVMVTLLERLDSQRRRSITVQDVHEVLDGDVTMEYYRSIADSSSEPLDRLVVWHLAYLVKCGRKVSEQITRSELQTNIQSTWKKSVRADELAVAIDRLVEMGVLVDEGTAVYLGAPIFATALCHRDKDVNAVIRGLL